MENNFLTIEHKTLSTDEFLRTKPVHCQRMVDHRLNGITKVLSTKLLPTHLEVSLVKVNFTDNTYEKGRMYSINGNTRKQIWSDNFDIKPDFLYVTIYFANNRTEVEQIYNSIDSTKSVENTGDKISGLYRANSIEPKSKKLTSRSIGRPLQLAYLCYNNGETKKSLVTEIDNKVEFEFFKDGISLLDTHYVTFNYDKIKSKKFASSNIMAALLVIGKKYGINHPRYTLLLHNLFNEIPVRKEGIGGLNDGVSVVWGNLYEKHQNNGWTDASGGGGPLMIGRILYCLDAFMNDIDISVRNNTSIKGIVMNDEKSKEFFKTYIKNTI
jgi:hypothetical protein